MSVTDAPAIEMPSSPPPEDGTRRFRPDIEGLRAVAVVTVVLAHSGLALHGGYIGVDVFFVISGFLITRQLIRELGRVGTISFAGFYARRARRILPAATIVIVATMLAAREWMSPLQIPSVTRDAVFAAFSGVNWRLAAQGTNYFASTAPPSPFQHYWSLSVEEQFYLVWPLLLVLIALSSGRRFSRARTTWVLLTIVAVSFTLSVVVTKTSQPYAYFGSHTRAWELALGALVAVGAPAFSRMRPALSSQMSWLGLGAIAVAAVKFGDSTQYPGSAVALPVVGAALVIAGGCAGPRKGAEFLLKLPPMQFLGRISYSWYLWHWPVLVIAPYALGHSLTKPQALGCVIGSLVVATVSFYCIEQPVRERTFFKGSARGLSTGLAMASVSICTALVVAANVTVPGGGVATADAASGTIAAPVAVSAGPLSLLEAKVAAGTQLNSIPAGLTPSLTGAIKDVPDTGNCAVGFTVSQPRYPCTVFGDPGGSETVAVVGDSHAGMWMPALDTIAKNQHWKLELFEKSGCPIADYPNFILPELGRTFTECNTWRTAVIGLVTQLKPALIVVAMETHDESLSETGMETSIKALAASGAQVDFLEDTPYPASSVPNCLAQNPNSIQKCTLNPKVDMLTSIQRQNEIEGATAGGAHVIDPTPWFCAASICPTVVGNTLVYIDSSHISATYAQELAPELQTAMLAVAAPKEASPSLLASAQANLPRTPQEAAVYDATQLQALPSNVTPSLSGAIKDLPEIHSCGAGYTQSVPKFPCGTFGDPAGTKTVVLMGDSHAGQWVPALSAVATAEHWKMDLFEKANCSPEIYSYPVSQVGGLYTQCTTWRNDVFALVKQIRPDYVVIAGLTRTVAKDGPQGMEAAVAALRESGAQVIFLEDTPYPQEEVPDCLAQHANNIQACALKVNDPYVQLNSRGRLNEITGAQTAGAKVIDPTPWFCTATVCPVVIDNIVVYIDNSHISATYSLKLAPVLQSAMLGVVN
jgi:peptidoglycan/LPS O-acetylase OafA/YrhL